MKKIKQIVFTRPCVAEYLDVRETDFEDIAPDHVAVKTYVSTVSPGTERANLIGDPNIAPAKGAAVEFPRALGYSTAGVVVKTGSAVTKFKVGDRVAMYWSKHVNYNVLPQGNLVKLDDDVSFEEGAISFIATFPLAAIRKVKLELGEPTMIMGLGLLGQIAVMLARAGGAYPVIACDPVKERREEALKNGADYAFDPLEEGFEQKVKQVSGGGVKAAIEVTGVGAGLNETLDCMAKFGRVALLGCTRSSDFTVDYYRKVHAPGITLVGAHTIARPDLESSAAYWTHVDDMKAVMALCKGGRLPLKSIIKQTHKPNECGEVFTRLANDRNFPICVQFDWRDEQ